MKWVLALCLAILVGCMAKVTVDRRPYVALPLYSSNSCTNPVNYVLVDQGYEVRYTKIGLNTDIQQMSAEISTNRTVRFQLGGLHSSMATNGISIRLDDMIKISRIIRESDYSTNSWKLSEN